MNASTYERIIERYLDGGLSPAEERQFQRLLESDPEVRRLFDAEMKVRRTIALDLDALPESSDRPYAAFLAALAATATVSEAAGGGGAAAAASGSSMGSTGWVAAGVLKYIGAALVVVGIGFGGYMATQTGLTGDTPTGSIRPAAPSTERLRGVEAERPPAPADAAPGVGPETPQGSGKIPSVSKPEPWDGITRHGAPASRLADHRRAVHSPSADRNEVGTVKEREEDLPLIESDSVHGRLNLTSEPGT